MKPVFVVMLCLLGAGVPQLRGAGHTSAAPNIVYILADDLGYGDVGCYNPSSKIPTPNLNRLAREGMRFTDAHAPSSVCTPTRYALLTGRYAWRSPLKRGVLGPWGTPIIAADRLTVPALLRQHGYATATIGKWHLGLSYTTKDGRPAALGEDKMSNVDFTKPIADGPTARGFDYYFGVNVPNYPPYCFIENDRTVGIPSVRDGGEADGINMPGPMVPGWKLVDVLPELARRTERWIVDAGNFSHPGPDGAVSRLSQRPQTAAHLLIHFDRLEIVCAQPLQPARAAGRPDVAVGRHQDGPHRTARQPLGAVPFAVLAIAQAHQPGTGRAHPHRAVAIRRHAICYRPVCPTGFRPGVFPANSRVP